MNTTGWPKGLRVTADGTGIVSHAGVALLRALADNIGLTAALLRGAAPHPGPLSEIEAEDVLGGGVLSR